ncbi:unnamed protein product [Spirodela intermedia]|uniref:Uncharacterized protein n=1 Tax=Spirodela intermedia TaxID=51605 RepID=A0A7I8K775_SPIIN|nr:unnamed protein product [Spirodela intermedia]
MDPPAENKIVGNSAAGPPPTAELLSGGKVMAEATQAFFQGQVSTVDKKKVAAAAGDMLGAGAYYGKANEKGYGEYVKKAEVYLEQYGSGGAAAAPAAAAPAAAGDSPATDAGGGGYMKVAEGLLGGGSDAGKSEGGGLGGDVMKMAGGFFK